MINGKAAALCLSFLIACWGIQARADGPPGSQAVFAKLSSLAGNWKRLGSDGSRFHIEFELTANRTVLVERWVNQGKTHSLTVYHMDGETLLATHYCPQGNQPRLRASSPGTGSKISFEFVDATGLSSPEQSHQHRLNFDLSDPEHIIRGEAYRQGKSSKYTEMTLVRTP